MLLFLTKRRKGRVIFKFIKFFEIRKKKKNLLKNRIIQILMVNFAKKLINYFRKIAVLSYKFSFRI